MPDNLVGYSRAGDAFHYRWAARRSLRLIYPNSDLEYIVVEGSNGTKTAGEYVIDLSEYYKNQDVVYYQLKHTTVNKNKPFLLSHFGKTLRGFAKRFLQHIKDPLSKKFSFVIVTNRAFSQTVKDGFKFIAAGGDVKENFGKSLKKYTNLPYNKLCSFCKCVELMDTEGDYSDQSNKLLLELSALIAGSVDTAEVTQLVALVQDKVLPNANPSITPEDVLLRFGITSPKKLYPAPTLMDYPKNVVARESQKAIEQMILTSSHPVIIHAPGGVGKTVFCQHFIRSLDRDSIGIVYDCFGAGSYRSKSVPRHRHRDALVQIMNELASRGLCGPMIVRDTSQETDILSMFIQGINTAITAIKQTNNSAKLYLIIDAADNAEMAAEERGENCFANELLREQLPQGCKLVMLCRTERVFLLKPSNEVKKIELGIFSENETAQNLRVKFPKASEINAREFHGLTGGNPRLQANALARKFVSVEDLLGSLALSPRDVDEQIGQQLAAAVENMRATLGEKHQTTIDAICQGLATLPPLVPIAVLAKVADVQVAAVRSFVVDIGRSFRIDEISVQFLDEPTETWFRKNYRASKHNLERYVNLLEPLAGQFSYVAEVLPQLYLQAEQYDKLIEVALSERFLPEDNPIDARNVLVYRLQFAFKAALKAKKYNDAIKLALRAGEEMAGNQRQIWLFESNPDLLLLLQGSEKIQELAFERTIHSHWAGSENAYSACLLSGLANFKGEAISFLRSATNWLEIYYADLRKKDNSFNNSVSNNDLVALGFAFLNVLGANACVHFFSRYGMYTTFEAVSQLTRGLIDAGDFDKIEKLLKSGKDKPYIVVAISIELLKVGRFPKPVILNPTLIFLVSSKSKLSKSHGGNIASVIVSFAEVCVHRGLSSENILKMLDRVLTVSAPWSISQTFSMDRTIFLKALAVRQLLSDKSSPDLTAILPEGLVGKEKNHEIASDITKVKEVINGLFPWFYLRIKIIAGKENKVIDSLRSANNQSKHAAINRYDLFPAEVAEVCASILILNKARKHAKQIYDEYLASNNSFNIHVRLETVRSAFRSEHLSELRNDLEISTADRIGNSSSEGPDEISGWYVALSRAVLNQSPTDANTYFDEAVRIVSKFGDELVSRWEATTSLAERAVSEGNTSDELAYRIIRMAELVGETVGREKYWDRDHAMEICAKMSPGIALAALSRWRERKVGDFESQLYPVLNELVGTRHISPAIGWALSRFSPGNNNRFVSFCLENESDYAVKQHIFADAVYFKQRDGASYNDWTGLRDIAIANNLEIRDLDKLIQYYYPKTDTISETKRSMSISGTAAKLRKTKLPDGKEIHTPDGFMKFYKHFGNGHFSSFWEGAAKKIKPAHEWDFVHMVLSLEELTVYDLLGFLSYIKAQKLAKLTYKQKWPSMVKQFGIRWAWELANRHIFASAVEQLGLKGDSKLEFYEAVVEGLAMSNNLASADQFFGFVKIASAFVEPDKALDLVDFSLTRFELHIDKDFGDGGWSDWLQVPNDHPKNVAGLIWSALGSPEASIRWEAAHCVRKLGEFQCIEVFEALIDWFKSDKSGPFGSKDFPFYYLHARLYLLMALSKVVTNIGELLKKHCEIFFKYATSEPHILIQKYSLEVLKQVENLFPGTLSEVDFKKVLLTGKSQWGVNKVSHDYSTESYWHDKGLVDLDLDVSFAYDFERYWFEPLGDVFGINAKQIEDLAANVVIKEFMTGTPGFYNDDPRVRLWNNHSNDTWYRKMDFPRTDTLAFYTSYHSLLVVAAKLIEKMPVVNSSRWSEDPLDDWIGRYSLSHPNSSWIADVRDPLPKRPDWTLSENKKEWVNDLQNNYYLNSIVNDKENGNWLTVDGSWEENDDSRTERYTVNTALVSRKTSNALANALSTFDNPYDFKLPEYGDDEHEIDDEDFFLRGWIKGSPMSRRLDNFDPYADSVNDQYWEIADLVVEEFSLEETPSRRGWYAGEVTVPSLSQQVWSCFRQNGTKEPEQSGSVVKANLSFLKQLCLKLDCEIIFDVGIKRDLSYSDQAKYVHPLHKLFVLSQNGELRGTSEALNLGKNLLTDLNLNSSFDVYTRWLVCYIAEKIVFISKYKGKKKKEVEEEFAKAIKALAVHVMTIDNLSEAEISAEFVTEICQKAKKSFIS